MLNPEKLQASRKHRHVLLVVCIILEVLAKAVRQGKE
jgi:hypothetical protein